MGSSAEINANVYTQTTDEGLRRAVKDVGQALTSSKKDEQLFTDCSLFSDGSIERLMKPAAMTGFRKSGERI